MMGLRGGHQYTACHVTDLQKPSQSHFIFIYTKVDLIRRWGRERGAWVSGCQKRRMASAEAIVVISFLMELLMVKLRCGRWPWNAFIEASFRCFRLDWMAKMSLDPVVGSCRWILSLDPLVGSCRWILSLSLDIRLLDNPVISRINQPRQASGRSLRQNTQNDHKRSQPVSVNSLILSTPILCAQRRHIS
ncbi:uncharacterized protein YALI1_A16991g [Yarrowia lipolytica]|uniref:Uncharacterized protein n=1 Tax=Yarrowia lipolytica TaxID=4952 RepID=A0A1D8N568_YARLL|nr:hypothetical protein YALI1_A16991g [Yarrowia lipolytica]